MNSNTLQLISGVKVTRTMVSKGKFPKAGHIFFIARGFGREARYEVNKAAENDAGTDAVIAEIIKMFKENAHKNNKQPGI